MVRHILASAEAKPDGAYSLPGKTMVPAVDRVLQGGKGAAATFFFRLYPAAPAPASPLSFCTMARRWFTGRCNRRPPPTPTARRR